MGAAAVEGPLLMEKLEKIDVTQQEAQEVYDMLDHERAGSVDIKAYANALKQLISSGNSRDIVNVEVTVGALAATLDELEKSYLVMEKHVSDFRDYADDFRKMTQQRIENIENLRKAALAGA